MITSLNELLPGDIILSRSGTWLSKAIRWVTSLQTGNAQYSHAGIAVGNSLLVEALWQISVTDVAKYKDQDIEVWRLPLDADEQRSLNHNLLQMTDEIYGAGKLFLFAADAIGTQISKLWGNKTPSFWFMNHFGTSPLPVCSELAAYALEKFTKHGLKDPGGAPIPWKDFSPDYLEDALNYPINNAAMIFKTPTAQ